MDLRRRKPPRFRQKLRALVLTPGRWGRALRHPRHPASRIPDAAHRIARGIGCGGFALSMPPAGLHFLLAEFLAWIICGNAIASPIGTATGTPLTFACFAMLSISLGRAILVAPAGGVPMAQVMPAFGQPRDGTQRNVRALCTARAVRPGRPERFFRGVFLPCPVGGTGPGLVAAKVSCRLSLPALNGYRNLRAAGREARAKWLSVTAGVMDEGNGK